MVAEPASGDPDRSAKAPDDPETGRPLVAKQRFALRIAVAAVAASGLILLGGAGVALATSVGTAIAQHNAQQELVRNNPWAPSAD